MKIDMGSVAFHWRKVEIHAHIFVDVEYTLMRRRSHKIGIIKSEIYEYLMKMSVLLTSRVIIYKHSHQKKKSRVLFER